MMPDLRSVKLLRGRGGGYGFTVSGEAPCHISWIADGSSAKIAGLEKWDCIVSVNGQNVYDAIHEHVVKLIGMSDNTLCLEVTNRRSSKYSSSEDDDLRIAHLQGSHTKRKLVHKPPHLSQRRPRRDDTPDFNRTEQVLNELKNGSLFKNLISALESNSYDIESSVASSGSSQSSISQTRRKQRVTELGITTHHNNTQPVPNSRHSFHSSKRPLHRRNLSLPIEGTHKASNNANTSNNVFVQSVVSYLGTVEIAMELSEDISRVCFSALGSCVQQLQREQHIHQRVLLKVMQNFVKLFNADGDVIAAFDGRQICFSASCHVDDRFFCIATIIVDNIVRCHQFMIDPSICTHRIHIEKSRRFAINCSMDTETGTCLEFPKSPKIILEMVEALFDPQRIKSPIVTTDMTQNPVIQEVEPGDNIATSPSEMDSVVDGMDGSTEHVQKHIKKKIILKASQREVDSNKLSMQNLKKHNMKSLDIITTQDANFNHYMAESDRLTSGKYKGGAGTLPLQRSSASKSESRESSTLAVRLSKRGKKGSRTGENLFFRVPKRSSSRQLKLNVTNMMSKSSESIPFSEAGQLSGASSIESLNSNASLPSYTNGIANLENDSGVAAWGISFDKMLEDSIGVKYFTEFLRKEFSQENILFWLECEKLRQMSPSDIPALKELADSIYERFLSDVATSPVNIDSRGQQLSEEALMKPPHPDMFEQQQNQIYKLMKLDSYSRFMKSSLYRRCLICQIEGLPLPLELEAQKDLPNEAHIESRHSFSLKHRRFFPRRSKKGQGSNDSIHRESSDSESGFIEALSNARPEDLATMHQVGVDASLICKLILWDGSSTVLYAEEGKATIREALNALCERRGVPLSAVDIYYQNEDRALALDQDVAVLAGQEVRVERRTLFRLDLLPIGRSVGVKAKPSKSTEEVLKPVVSKYGLDFDDLQTTLSGEKKLLDMSQPVQILDGLRILVDYIPEKSQDSNDKASSQKSNGNESRLPDQKDTEDLINIMSAAQSGKMHDQRGLISEMNLELPDFLKTPILSPPKHTASTISSANSNNNSNVSKEISELPHPNNTYVYPNGKGAKLSPNPAGTGNAKARIQKLKHTGNCRSPSTPPLEVRTFRQKIPSLETNVSKTDAYETDSLSAVDDDPFVITKWMQSVSCTPKYSYSADMDNTLGLVSPSVTAGMKDSVLHYDDGSSSSHSSIAHDHGYTKTKETM